MMAELEFKINKYITLKLEKGKTIIYVAGKKFRQCKFLVLNIPVDEVESLNELKSIDEATEILNPSLKYPPESERIRKTEIPTYEILPEEEFWGLCSNMQVWNEHEYNTRLLHANLAFPLLKKLVDIGDPQAKRIFKEELIERYNSGVESVREYLRRTKYLRYLSLEEFITMIEDEKEYNAVKKLTAELHRTDNLDIDIKKGKVVKIRLQAQKLRYVPEHIRELSSLENLILSYNLLGELPDWIGDFQNLTILEATDNLLKQLPESIGKLKLLDKLNVSNNKITELPKSIGRLKALKILEIYQNELVTLPEAIGYLINLELLDLHENKLNTLPNSIGSPKSLKELYLHKNELQRIPDSIEDLKNLERLSLSNNLIRSLPDTMNLNKLNFLAIYNNPLNELPDSLYKLPKLRDLYIDNTNLREYQITKDNFKNKYIYIHYHKIWDSEKRIEDY